MVIIVDFGSQTAHLIGRRLKQLGVTVEYAYPEDALRAIRAKKPKGIVFSGGPSSVYEKGAPTINSAVFRLGIPILGICYGWQLAAHLLGGKVIPGDREYGPTQAVIASKKALFQNVDEKTLTVWMSHGDEVVELPVGFDYHASTPRVRAAGVANFKSRIFGVQFHPEVEHTQEGKRILRNFAEGICGLPIRERVLKVDSVIDEVRRKVNEKGTESRVIAAVSGGVDSTVASAIVSRAIGKRFIPVYCDNGLMREGTRKEVCSLFTKLLRVRPQIISCQGQFLHALKGVTDPEKKRTRIGALYIKLFEQTARKKKNIRFLMQGTIYSDVIESKGTRYASKIKSHHNVGGLPQKMRLALLEPLCTFYKDEVRELGRQLGLPSIVLNKHPFPGPGQAIRVIGEVTRERLKKQQIADQIVLRIMREEGWYDRVFQSFPVMTGVRTTAVKGDGRVYGELVGLRVYDSSDIMTAGWTRLPYDILQKIASRIVNEVPDVSRVVYDITTKPPATMEWE